MECAAHGVKQARSTSLPRTVTRWLLAAAYAFAGYMHISAPSGFIAITPGWVPDPALVVWATGWCEIAGAIGLLVPPALLRWPRPAAGIGLANVNHAVSGIAIGGATPGWWYHGPRLALQPLIIWTALWAGGVVDWPFGKRRG
jgi:uncharacterized membrane protein